MSQAVLFVCLGNICRSPTAEAVFRYQAERAGLHDRLIIDSAGTAAYHVGEPPDRRAQAAGRERGYDLAPLRARQVHPDDFARFHWVLAMDHSNLADLMAACPAPYQDRVRLFLDFVPADRRSALQLTELEVPDPYYGGSQGFERVLDLCEAASDGLIQQLAKAR